MNYNRLNYLIERYLNSSATDQELKELNDWYADVDYGDKGLDEWIREEHGLENITARMFRSFTNKVNTDKKRRSKIVNLQIGAIAASLMVFSGLVFLIKTPTKRQTIATKKSVNIPPGNSVAILTLANGQKIILNAQPTGKVSLQNGVSIIKKRNGLLTYTLTPASTATTGNTFNSVETPRGGQYQVVLPDGTEVWLNAASKLTYPTRFNTKDRCVKLSGEAYFEVAHDPNHPFHVLFGNQDVKVLGTHFNISAYPDDAESKTTLLQGSITLTKSGVKQPVLLIPGQQATSSAAAGNISVQTVNTDQVISWKNGYFQFDNMKISSIMKVMGRWYDVDIKYKHVDQNERFGGTFSRNTNLNDILDNIENIGNAHFEISGRTIIVDSKKGGL